MSTPIIAALRANRQLPSTYLYTAIELAHRASIYGVVRISHARAAYKRHHSVRSQYRHHNELIKAGILRKSIPPGGKKFGDINVYVFTIDWQKKMSSNKPNDTPSVPLPQIEREGKNFSLREEIQHWEKALRFCTKGSDAYQTTLEKLERLKQLQEDAHARQ